MISITLRFICYISVRDYFNSLLFSRNSLVDLTKTKRGIDQCRGRCVRFSADLGVAADLKHRWVLAGQSGFITESAKLLPWQYLEGVSGVHREVLLLHRHQPDSLPLIIVVTNGVRRSLGLVPSLNCVVHILQRSATIISFHNFILLL